MSKIKLPKNTSQRDVADNIKSIRTKQNLSAKEAAALANLPENWITSLEDGKRLPSENDIQILCDIFVCKRKNITRNNGHKNTQIRFSYNSDDIEETRLIHQLNSISIMKVSVEDIFECGIRNIEDFWDKKYEMNDVIFSKNNGVDSVLLGDTQYKDYSEEIVILSKWGNFYYVYGIPSVTDGFGDDYLSFGEMMTYDKKEAVDYYNSISYQYVPIPEMKKMYEKEINNDRIYCDYKANAYEGYWNLKIDYNLILEKYPELTLEDIHVAFKKYDDLEKELRKESIFIDGIYKRKEFPGNQRYYVFDFNAIGETWKYEAHIPSKMQHKKRNVLDYLDVNFLEEIKEKVKNFIDEGGATCELCGGRMLKTKGCTVDTITINDKKYKRIPHPATKKTNCGDCNTSPGHYHHFGCDMEMCPECGEQLLFCDCNKRFDNE